MKGGTDVVLITGHPATGKTTLAHRLAEELKWPLIWKDGIKEPLMDALPDENGGWSMAWSRKLGRATYELLYLQVETLLEAEVNLIVESNFDPRFANARWQALCARFSPRLIQLRCQTDPAVQFMRHHARIAAGERHPGHVDGGADRDAFMAAFSEPLGWIDLPGPRLPVDTTALSVAEYKWVVTQVRQLLRDNASE